ncbi:MAG TPA: DUF3592 domain-containing protein, partial [Candidatus Eisenbacteria bacterium]
RMGDRSPGLLARLAGSPEAGVQIVLGVLTLGTLVTAWYEYEPLLTFRPVDAVVAGSDVARTRLTLGHGSTTGYQPEIFFRYEVAGTPYMGTQYCRTVLGSSLVFAELQARSFVAGSRVRVWYNPRRPDDAVVTRAPYPALCLGMLLVLLLCRLGVQRARPPAQPARPITAPTH